jgi:hypothetical protein
VLFGYDCGLKIDTDLICFNIMQCVGYQSIDGIILMNFIILKLISVQYDRKRQGARLRKVRSEVAW